MSTTVTIIRFRTASAPERVDEAKGIIYGVSAMQMVQPKGHPVAVDQTTLEAIARLGNASASGIKVHFKHRDVENNQDALGSQVARAKSFRVVGDKVVCDLHLLSAAKISPSGNLHDYVLKLAAEAPEDFGMSVIMRFGRAWKMSDGSEVIGKERPAGATGDLPFARPTALATLDFVDDPAANQDGLFSANDTDPDDTTSTTGNAMKIANDRLAALKAEHPDHAALILDRAIAGDDEVQLRAKIGDARMSSLTTEVGALKAKIEKQGTDHAAELKKVSDEKAALQKKFDDLAALKAGANKDPGGSPTDADPEATIKAKWAALSAAERTGCGNDFEAFRALQKLESGEFKPEA